MTWLDIALIVVMVIFIALGARMGSLWTGACLIGGFFGALLVEIYTLPASEMIGGFTGARLLAGALLFAGGVVVALVPGWVLSRLVSAVFLGFFDSVVGLLAGALTGIVAITLLFLFVLPHAPRVEKSPAWKQSKLVKPLHHMIEDFFNDRRFRRGSTIEQLRKDLVKDVRPVMEETGDQVKSAFKKIKKK